jgi:hypothetical protein
MRRFSLRRFLLGTCIATVVAVVISSGPAFTAPAGAEGWHAHRVSGYVVSNVHYALDGDRVASVSFTLDAPARQATARLNDVEAPCELDGTNATCSLADAVSVTDLGTLSVDASS